MRHCSGNCSKASSTGFQPASEAAFNEVESCISDQQSQVDENAAYRGRWTTLIEPAASEHRGPAKCWRGSPAYPSAQRAVR